MDWYYWVIIMFLLAVIVVILFLLNKTRKLTEKAVIEIVVKPWAEGNFGKRK